MENPFLRKATSLQASFLESSVAQEQVEAPIDYSQLRFSQLVFQLEGIRIPRGSIKKKLAWAERNFGDRVSDADYGYVPKSKVRAWRKWKKLIKLALLDELAQDSSAIAESEDTTIVAPDNIEPIIDTIQPVIIPEPEIIINPAPPIPEAIEIKEVEVEPIIINPAPPIPEVLEIEEVEVEPIIINPAPPIPEVLEIEEVKVEPIIINPAPPWAEIEPEVAVEIQPIVNPAPPVTILEPEIIINPAPPVPELIEPSVEKISSELILIANSLDINDVFNETVICFSEDDRASLADTAVAMSSEKPLANLSDQYLAAAFDKVEELVTDQVTVE